MSAGPVLLAGLCGFCAGWCIQLLADWLPRRILHEDQCWLAKMTDRPAPEPLSLVHVLRDWRWNHGRLWLLPLATAALTGALLGLHGITLPHLLEVLLCWALLTLAAADMRHQLLPDSITLPMLWLSLLAQLHPATRSIGVEAALLGAALGYLLLWALAKAYRMARGQDGLGQGDMKLLALAGAWLGPGALPAVLFIGCLLGLLWQGLAIWRGRAGRHSYFAFGPWLVVATLLYLARAY